MLLIHICYPFRCPLFFILMNVKLIFDILEKKQQFLRVWQFVWVLNHVFIHSHTQSPIHLFSSLLLWLHLCKNLSVVLRPLLPSPFQHLPLQLPVLQTLLLLLLHNIPSPPRDHACLFCLLHVSAQCSCAANLSFKYLFLPSRAFLFLFPSRLQSPPTYVHTSIRLWNLKLCFFQLGSGAL